VDRLALIQEPLDVVAFFGSWCQQCKHVLPGLLRVHALTENPNFTVTLIALDEEMLEPVDWIERCGVVLMPTFIVRINGEEIGRIEEEPEASIEADLVRILSANGY
jgi:hypothetical protein